MITVIVDTATVAARATNNLITKDNFNFIAGLARIRNRYAHNVKNMHRSLKDILGEEQKNNKPIVEKVTGLEGITLPDDYVANGTLKMFMYFRLADYLADALDTLRPPPIPAGVTGLLGSLLNIDAPNTPLPAEVAAQPPKPEVQEE